MVYVHYVHGHYSCLRAGLRLKSIGLVQRSAATWRCSAFIACRTVGELPQWLCHNDSTVNSVISKLITVISVILG